MNENKPEKKKPGRPRKENASIPAAKDPDNVPVKRKRGRPKGSGGNKRPDKKVMLTEPGENTKYLFHDMKIAMLPDIDMNNQQAIQERINLYFSICADDDIKPTIESLALAFHVSRFVLYDWMNDRTGNRISQESKHTIKKAYDIINSYYAHMMNNGKINPVAGIFLMKNNYGYKDVSDYVLTTDNNNQITLSDITDRASLLDE